MIKTNTSRLLRKVVVKSKALQQHLPSSQQPDGDANGRICAHDLFSFFTETIIKQNITFQR